MRKNLNITFIQNITRRNALKEYRSLVEKYFQTIDYNEYSRDIIDSDKSKDVRKWLNSKNEAIQTIFRDVGITPNIVYTPPPAIGGYIQRINLIDNLFNLQNYDIEIQALLDFIDQVDGVYQQDFINSILRTFNPFYWLGRLLEFIASIPFYLLGSVGFNREKVENSAVGKLVKWLIKFFTLIFAVWEAMARLSLLPANIDVIRILKGF